MHTQRRVLIAITTVAVITAAVLFVFQITRTTAGTPLVLGQGSAATTYTLEKVTDSAAQARGLSGRANLGPNAGMLFAYSDTMQRCMWMKDMRFAIDVIWFDANYRISSIASNLSPATYPQTYCADAKYFVELPAGAATQHGLRVGQIAKF